MSKLFKPTTLYIKTHNVTGLKYFGKTTGNPHEYRGSGIYWTAHLRKHGYDVTTEVLGYYTDKDECTNAANLFSIENNIVKDISYKPNVDIFEESQQYRLCVQLLEEGFRVYVEPDPNIPVKLVSDLKFRFKNCIQFVSIKNLSVHDIVQLDS